MTAIAEIIALRVLRTEPCTLSYLEQKDWEWSARFNERKSPPYRTRPLLVVDNEKAMRP